ncbi:uncharacterized protein PGTG_17647 [Puccinia graminis f. sp. tritici CRL 75-36-700-3]|uniref:Calcineurin-like phosphoesterase domain-containing protein n=1 Tax=Puccinia graminis f. sp. tritici (strain CRL 75-36-700-3 / race SCCL) TaxID=418459 RepID=E3L4W8_PUCGT|nr:uncharacterized protein PGTG_17647 [Puccinia graminis f. sp. tritici CRL 75-36-700-3]EFP91593.2 hypothetical protein PGTG_17647 [Puccinia graminis f. sp. tritici CRL 75-36-700-3]
MSPHQPSRAEKQPIYHPRRLDRSLLILRIVWIITIVWGEWIYFDRTISSCQWPRPTTTTTTEPFHLLIIADPQLPSTDYSYPDRILPLRWLSIKIIDQFIRKSWRLLIKNTKPHAVVFLGDLLDGGIAASDPAKFQTYVDRFYHTFPIPADLSSAPTSNQTEPPARLIHLVGNHDVGLYPSTSYERSAQARERFKNTWPPGLLNGHVEWANHTIIWIDALSLIEESKRRAAGLSTQEDGQVTRFVKELAGADMLLPKVLLTHVPLWRPEGTSCGPLRESRRDIRQGAGINYQNEIPEEATKMVLEKIQPSLVFSGDDHDYCEVIHTLPSTSLANPSPLSIHEISVKSFSMGMGVQEPGYQLVTLSNPGRFGRAPDEQTTFHRPCLLPNQIRIYTHLYLPLLLMSLVVLFGPEIWRRIRRRTRGGTSREQARTNGLPIHHRAQRHRKSLSRTLMFTKPISSSSSSSSSADEARSDEEAGPRFASHRARRSASLGLAIGLGIDHGDGFHSPSGLLSYHSPVDSGHDDQRFSHPSPALPFDHSHKLRRSVELTQNSTELSSHYPSHHHSPNAYPPTHLYGRSLSSRFQSSSSIPSFSSLSSSSSFSSDHLSLKLLRLFLGHQLSERLRNWLINHRFISPSHSTGTSSVFSKHRRRKKNNILSPLCSGLRRLFGLVWVVLLVFFSVWFSFDL